MTTETSQRQLGKLLAATSAEDMATIAERYGFVVDGKIDLRGRRVRFSHSNLDLGRFLLAGADLSGSEFLNCSGVGVSFEGCVLRKVRFEATRPCSMAGADFSRCQVTGSYFGRATLDLTGARFRNSLLERVEFMQGRLASADFAFAELSDVTLRRAILEGASFRGAKLTRVSLEKAVLRGADFTEANFVEMEHWGEPDFEGALISDELRYQYGIVQNPVRRLDAMLTDSDFSEEERRAVARFRAAVENFAGSSNEAMLIASEFEEVIPRSLFIRVLKRLKTTPIH